MSLRIALTKGRLEKNTVELFKRCGFDVNELENKGRKLFIPVPNFDLEVVLAKSPDVITYVERGVCDMGIVGKDTIMEHGKQLYEIMDLGFGKCRFALIAKNAEAVCGGYKKKIIATKYPKVAKDYFDSKNIDIEIIKIDGSVELAPLLGLSDGIVDIVETGTTIKENGLSIIEEIAPSSARLIVNVASMKMKKDKIDAFLAAIKENL
ncbi:MAG: ATP phosphoribosyltransferase [Clostridia bacterium]|nr:ATP phosphoribosyltransferase [Clostridia bacterium]